LVARAIERVGIPTVTLNMIWEFQRIVGMPRIAAIEHPFGRPFGDVGDRETQGKVLLAALKLFEEADKAGYIKHLDLKWHLQPKETKWHPAEPAPIILKLKKAGLI
tara:strand:- start:279 stop:596 length:318 start_codon:yes stop_codon:yes gene_type:complete